MNKNEKIQLILEEISKKSSLDITTFSQNKFQDHSRNLKELNLIIDTMLNNDLIEHIGRTDRFFKITLFGQEVLDSGGWILNLKKKEELVKNENELKSLENQKLKSETKILRWKEKTFWYLFFLALIGGICGIISLILQLVEKYKLIILTLILLQFIACNFFTDKAYPVYWGMANGKVIECRGSDCYMLDLGSIYKPEKETAIFIGAIGPNHEERIEWVIEADLKTMEFVRGIGKEPFPKWPDEIVNKTIEIIKGTDIDESYTGLEHPFQNLTKEERIGFIYTLEFDPAICLEAVQYWTYKKAEHKKEK
ncbi:MAG: hypothetical protein WC599_11405 [Bacteroidales bacterium]